MLPPTVINITWSVNVYDVLSAQPYINDPHINQLELRDGNGALIPNLARLYVIIDAAGQPIYAGRSLQVRNRFDDRGNALREFGTDPGALFAGYTVDIASVAPGLHFAASERWLVRTLYLADQANMAQVLTNVQYTGQYFAPAGGLTVNNLGNVPGYLNAVYVYAGGAAI